MTKGWIKLYRSFLDWEWYGDINVRLVALHILLKANPKDGKWQGVKILRGQLVTSSELLAEEVGLTRQMVRTALKKLKQSGFIKQKSTNRFIQITICKYDTYQCTETNNQPTSNQQITNKQPTSNQQATTSKEYKEIKNIRNNKRSTIVDPKNENSDFENSDEDLEEAETTTINLEEEKEKSCAKKEKESLKPINPHYQKFLIWLEEEAPRVLKMKEPITERQYLKLTVDYKDYGEEIKDTLISMHNTEPLLRRYVSANATLRSWVKNRIKDKTTDGTTNTTRQPYGVAPDYHTAKRELLDGYKERIVQRFITGGETPLDVSIDTSEFENIG